MWQDEPTRRAWNPTNPRKTIQKPKPNVNDFTILLKALLSPDFLPLQPPSPAGSSAVCESPSYHTLPKHLTTASGQFRGFQKSPLPRGLTRVGKYIVSYERQSTNPLSLDGLTGVCKYAVSYERQSTNPLSLDGRGLG